MMNLRIAALVCAVLAFSSTAYGQQDSRNKAFVEQQIKLQRMKQAGLITEAQRQAMELKALQQLRGQNSGPKTGFDPTMQGGMPMMTPPQQSKETQADKSRAALKKKAEAKKAQKKGGKEQKAGDEKADKADKENKPQKK
jgi:hypothetical protein